MNEIEICKLPTLPGTWFWIQGWKFPTARCNIIGDLMVELHEREMTFITIGKVCGGINLASGALVIYKDELDGEIGKYLNLAPRCQLHQETCCSCHSKATLYDKDGVKNLKLLETLKQNLHIFRVTDTLYEASFEVQFCRNFLF